MPPILKAFNFKNRYSTKRVGTVDTFKTFHILCEWTVTEPKYFKAIRNCNFLNVRNNIEVEILKRTESDKGRTQLSELFKLMKQYIDDNKLTDDDIPVLVVDFDAHKDNPNFIDEIKAIEAYGIKVFGNSPCFELWLILHIENALNTYILPNKTAIYHDDKISNVHTFTSSLASKILGFNTKYLIKPEILSGIYHAIDQSTELENDLYKLNKDIGTNLQFLIKEILRDERFTNDNN